MYQSGHLAALTSIRFFAAMAVVGFHFNGSSSPEPVRTYLRFGELGVSLFFVLSGFILTHRYREELATFGGKGAFVRFYQARFARVYPLHFLTLLAMTGVGLVVLNVGQSTSTTRLAGSWLAHAAVIHAWSPTTVFAWNMPSWSIASEAFFYLIFPFVLAFGVARLKTPRMMVMALMGCWTTSLVAALLIVMLASGAWETVLLTYFPLTRMWEFFMGVAAALLWQRSVGSGMQMGRLNLADARHRSRALGAILVALLLLPLVIALARIGLPHGAGEALERIEGTLFSPLWTALILVLATGRTVLSRLLEWPFLVLLGEASYAIYMIHWVFVKLVWHWFEPGSTGRALATLGSVAVILVLSVLIYRYVETPMRLWLRPRRRRREQAMAIPSPSSIHP